MKKDATTMLTTTVVGVVELSSETMSKRELLDVWLKVKRQCYANAAMTTELGGFAVDFLRNEIGVFEIVGAEINDGKLTVYYRDELVK